MPRRKPFFGALQLLVTVGVLGYLFNNIPFLEVIDAISSISLEFLVLACIASLLAQPILAYQLLSLAEKQGISLSSIQALDINLTSAFYGLFLPGGTLTQGVVRFLHLSRTGLDITGALSAVAFYRAAVTVTACLLGIFFWLMDYPSDLDHILIGMIIVAGGVLLTYILFFTGGLLDRLGDFLTQINLSNLTKKAQELLLYPNHLMQQLA